MPSPLLTLDFGANTSRRQRFTGFRRSQTTSNRARRTTVLQFFVERTSHFSCGYLLVFSERIAVAVAVSWASSAALDKCASHISSESLTTRLTIKKLISTAGNPCHSRSDRSSVPKIANRSIDGVDAVCDSNQAGLVFQ